MANDAVIGEQTRVDGSVAGDTNLTLHGVIDGDLELAARFDLQPSGFVSGTIEAEVVDVAGAVDGAIVAEELVVLRESARVRADISAPAINIEPGAQVAGEVDVDGEESGSTTTTNRSSTGSRTTSTSASSRSRTTSTARSSSRSSSTDSNRSARSSNTSNPSNRQATTDNKTTAAATGTTTKERSQQESAENTPKKDKQAQSQQDEDQQQEPAEQKAESEAQSEAEDTDSPEKSVADLDREEISEEYTVRELRDELRRRNMKVGGTKSELINRLLSDQSEQD